MCLIGIHLGTGPRLLITANRDEFAGRPTMPLHWWQEGLLAGKDLQAGGTWLGITRSGRFAAVTNVRDPALRTAAVPFGSRGLMVKTFLLSDCDPQDYAQQMLAAVSEASPYNLILGRIQMNSIQTLWLGGRSRALMPLQAGSHVLSNAELNTPWPKARRLKAALATEDEEAIDAVMHSQTLASDDELPATGVSFGWEKRLSAALISGEDYHTRSSTLIRLDPQKASIREITWSPSASAMATLHEHFEFTR
ncbi:MAG: NRDE family protein [Betaproteobacteria bacterium]|nr:NRDE family protein [Betaproteobacteria bacterium]